MKSKIHTAILSSSFTSLGYICDEWKMIVQVCESSLLSLILPPVMHHTSALNKTSVLTPRYDASHTFFTCAAQSQPDVPVTVTVRELCLQSEDHHPGFKKYNVSTDNPDSVQGCFNYVSIGFAIDCLQL